MSLKRLKYFRDNVFNEERFDFCEENGKVCLATQMLEHALGVKTNNGTKFWRQNDSEKIVAEYYGLTVRAVNTLRYDWRDLINTDYEFKDGLQILDIVINNWRKYRARKS